MRLAKHRRLLLVILASALCVRVGAAFGVQYVLDHVLKREFVIEGDAAGYWELGRRISAGEPYSLYDPPRFVLRMPGFPFLLAAGLKTAAALGLQTKQFLACRLLLALLATAGVGFVYLLGAELFDTRTGLWAAAITGISPAVVGFSVLILSETAFAVTLVLNLWCMARLVKLRKIGAAWKRGLLWSAAVGGSGGLACLMRPSWLLAIPFFAACLVLSSADRRWGAACAAIVLVALAGSLLPWAVRNHSVTGRWIFTTLWSGPSLYDGLNPQATGDSDMRFFDEDGLMHRMTEYEVDQHYRRLAWDFVRQHPGRTIELAFLKLGRYWNPFPNAGQFSQWWVRWPLALFTIVAMGFALYGGVLHRADIPAWAICAGPLFYFAAIHSVFVGSVRYRLPAEYPAYVLSAAGIVGMKRTKRKQNAE